jgi:hypothetical protein
MNRTIVNNSIERVAEEVALGYSLEDAMDKTGYVPECQV